MGKIYPDDFNMMESNPNGLFVRISEINKMIEAGAITVDREKMKEYKFDTTVMYNKEKILREEAINQWNYS